MILDAGLNSADSQAVEVVGIVVGALWIVHPGNLLSVFGWLRDRLQPVVQVATHADHLLIQLLSLVGRSSQDILIDTKHGPVNA